MTVVIERLCTEKACLPLSTRPSSAKPPKPRDAAEIITNPSKGLVVHDSGWDGTLDGKLLEHIKEKTHMVVADAAGDGQHAFENLKKSGVLGNLKLMAQGA